MANSPFDNIQARLADFLGQAGQSGLTNPLTQLIKQSLQDMEFVSLEDFEVQREVLNRLRLKVSELEAKIQALEQRS